MTEFNSRVDIDMTANFMSAWAIDGQQLSDLGYTCTAAVRSLHNFYIDLKVPEGEIYRASTDARLFVTDLNKKEA